MTFSSIAVEKEYQRSRAAGKERMLTLLLVVMSIITVSQVPFFELEDPVQMFRMGTSLIGYCYCGVLRILFHLFPRLAFHWDYFVFVGASLMIVCNALSYDRVSRLLGEQQHPANGAHEVSSQVSIAAVLLGVGILLEVRWQCFAALAIVAPTSYLALGHVLGCASCVDSHHSIELGAVLLAGLGLLIFTGNVLHERDRRCRWDAWREAETLNSRLKTAHSLRERLLRAVFDVSFAAQITQSGDLQVVGEWPALDSFMGTLMAERKLSSFMPSGDRARFLEYVRLAVSTTGEAGEALPAFLLQVHFEPESGCSLTANMYIVSAAEESVLTVCLSTKGACYEDNGCLGKDSNLLDITSADQASKALWDLPKLSDRPRPPPPPSLHSAPTELAGGREPRLLSPCCEGDCLRPDSVAWVEGQALPQPLKTMKPGQKVLCHDSLSNGLKYTEVLNVHTEAGKSNWVDVTLEDGTSLQMTSNHPVQPITGNASVGAVRAIDLSPGSDYIMVMKTMPVLVQKVVNGVSAECQERVFLTLHQPERHSLFVAAPPGAEGAGLTAVQTMAVGSADARPHYDLTAKNTFINIEEQGQPRTLKRSNSAPPDVIATKIALSHHSSLTPSHQSSTISSAFGDAEVLVTPAMRPVLEGDGTNPKSLKMEPREFSDVVSLSEVFSIHSVAVRSLGSAGHAQGACRTCLFQNRSSHVGGEPCWKGVFCERCHEDHTKMERKKPKTGRERARTKLKMLL